MRYTLFSTALVMSLVLSLVQPSFVAAQSQPVLGQGVIGTVTGIDYDNSLVILLPVGAQDSVVVALTPLTEIVMIGVGPMALAEVQVGDQVIVYAYENSVVVARLENLRALIQATLPPPDATTGQPTAVPPPGAVPAYTAPLPDGGGPYGYGPSGGYYPPPAPGGYYPCAGDYYYYCTGGYRYYYVPPILTIPSYTHLLPPVFPFPDYVPVPVLFPIQFPTQIQGNGIQTISTLLGITPLQLLVQLGRGSTLSQLAVARGIDPVTFQDALFLSFQQALAQAVSFGIVTPTEAANLLTNLQSNAGRLLNDPAPLALVPAFIASTGAVGGGTSQSTGGTSSSPGHLSPGGGSTGTTTSPSGGAPRNGDSFPGSAGSGSSTPGNTPSATLPGTGGGGATGSASRHQRPDAPPAPTAPSSIVPWFLGSGGPGVTPGTGGIDQPDSRGGQRNNGGPASPGTGGAIFPASPTTPSGASVTVPGGGGSGGWPSGGFTTAPTPSVTTPQGGAGGGGNRTSSEPTFPTGRPASSQPGASVTVPAGGGSGGWPGGSGGATAVTVPQGGAGGGGGGTASTPTVTNPQAGGGGGGGGGRPRRDR